MKFEVEASKVEDDFKEFNELVDAIDTKPADKYFIQLLSNLCLNVPQCDRDIIERFSKTILDIIKQVSFIKMYHSSYRQEFVKAAMRLCNKGTIDPVIVYETLLLLITCEDKKVRLMVCQFIVNDIKQRNLKSSATDINRKAKVLLQKWIMEREYEHANTGAKMLIQLYRKGVWTDALTVNVLADCCTHKSTKVRCTAIRFFLNKSSVGADNDTDDSDSDTEISKGEKMRKIKLAHRVGKKSQTRKKHMEKELNNIKKKKKKKHNKPDSMYLECNVLALQLVRDPLTFAEKLMSKTRNAVHHLRMLMLELLSRLIGYYKLQLDSFYSYLVTLLSPKTVDVTQMLVYAAQAAHEMVSPEDIQPVVKMIADKFANEGISDEGIALGLNSIREICARCPHAMPDELLTLLLEFRRSRNKNVVSAIRSVIRLFRELNPELLPKSERGRPTEASVDVEVQGDATRLPRTYGEMNAVSFVPGSEIIEENAIKDKGEHGENEENEEYEECSDDSSSASGEWMDVVHDDDSPAPAIIDPEQRRLRAEAMSYDHIFTDAEHLAIKKNLAQKAEKAAIRCGKRKHDEMIEIDSDTGEVNDPNEVAEFVSESAIIRMAKKAKASKEERVEAIEDGRVGRKKYGFAVNRFNPTASTTNREKSKKKNYQMVRHKKAHEKQKLSLKEKNKMMRDHIAAKAKFMRS